jgi:hypothetical protein
MLSFKQYLLEMTPGNYALTSFEADEDVDTIDDRTGASGTMASLTDELDLGSDLLRVGVNIPKIDHPHIWRDAIQLAKNRVLTGNHGHEELLKMTDPERQAWGRELDRKYVDFHIGLAQGLLDADELLRQRLPATAANIFKITPPPQAKK